MKAADCFVNVIDNNSDVIDVDAFSLESFGATLFCETEVEAVGSADNAPSGDAIVALLLELKPKKCSIEAGRHVKIADRDIHMIETFGVHRRSWAQSRTHLRGLDVYAR
jgi:hypothetical protein